MVTALVLVDLQNDYFPGGRMELVGPDYAAAFSKDLLTLFRKNRWPIFHVQHIAVHSGANFFLPDTEGVDINTVLAPTADESVVQKHYPNSFKDTSLHKALKNANVTKVVICGAMSHMCIDATTRAAADLGFECTVIHDACATMDLEFAGRKIPAEAVHGAFMSALASAYARVLSLESFLALAESDL